MYLYSPLPVELAFQESVKAFSIAAVRGSSFKRVLLTWSGIGANRVLDSFQAFLFSPF